MGSRPLRSCGTQAPLNKAFLMERMEGAYVDGIPRVEGGWETFADRSFETPKTCFKKLQYFLHFLFILHV